jgi:hypothetical protein
MIALLLADLLIGPISRRYLAAVVVSGTLFFNFYGVFRQHQNQDLGSALTATVDESQRYEAMERGEEAAMIVKDAYAVTYTDAVGTIMSYDYYPRSALNLLPLQVIPSKRQWVQGATFLSGELLRTDYRDYGSGVAGAIIADGYMMDHERGVLVLSLVLGVLAAFVSRWLLLPRRGAAGPRLWAIAIYAATLVQMANYVRGDLATIVMYLTYYTLFPWALLSFVRWRTDSPWHQELALRR